MVVEYMMILSEGCIEQCLSTDRWLIWLSNKSLLISKLQSYFESLNLKTSEPLQDLQYWLLFWAHYWNMLFLLIVPSCVVFSDVILRVSTNFRPFISFICSVSLYWMAFLVSVFCFNGSLLSLTPISNNLVWSFESFTFLLYFCPCHWNWHNHLFCLWQRGWFPPISELKWWRDDDIFMILHHLFDAFLWFRDSSYAFCLINWFIICNYYVALLHHMFNTWFESWLTAVCFNNSLITCVLLSFLRSALIIFILLCLSFILRYSTPICFYLYVSTNNAFK